MRTASRSSTTTSSGQRWRSIWRLAGRVPVYEVRFTATLDELPFLLPERDRARPHARGGVSMGNPGAPRRYARSCPGRMSCGWPSAWLFWAALLPFLKRIMPLPRLVSVMTPAHRRAPDERRSAVVVTLARWAYKTGALRDNCLERSLITYRYLPAGNDDSRLVLGVRKGDDGPPGHAWLTCAASPSRHGGDAGEPRSDRRVRPRRTAMYRPRIRHPRAARRARMIAASAGTKR